MRLAIIIGHNASATGAMGVKPMAMSEWHFNFDFVFPLIEEYATKKGLEVKAFNKTGYTSKAIGVMVDTWLSRFNRKCCIELHFNSATPAAYGTETLAEADQVESLKLADIVQKKMCEAFGRKSMPGGGNRGIKKLSIGGRGHYNLLCVTSPAVLVEPTFAGSNITEATLLWNRKRDYARALVDAALEFMKIHQTKK